MNVYWIAAAWVAMALLASLISIRVGISVALVELVVGAVVGNIPGHARVVQQTEFTNFLATLWSAVLTFLAGAEIDPHSLRRNWKASLALGAVSFAAPFVGALLFARYGLAWDWPAAEIAGVSLSTTSLAVVYAVMTRVVAARGSAPARSRTR
jgi:Kef-type K+ transport system membrane component KefB